MPSEPMSWLVETYTTAVAVYSLLAGLLTITVERYLYARRGYRRAARLAAILGWCTIAAAGLTRLLAGWVEAGR